MFPATRRLPSVLVLTILSGLLGMVPATQACAQGTVPTFRWRSSSGSYRLLGRTPSKGGTTVIPTELVPIQLAFESKLTAGRPSVVDAAGDVPAILASPLFARFAFPSGGTTQYADALLRSTFSHAANWHTELGSPLVRPIRIVVPKRDGYLLKAKRDGTELGIVDVRFLQKAIFRKIPREHGKLVIAVTRNTAFYAHGRATLCCSWGTHGVDVATGDSFVLASYLDHAPPIVRDHDIQPLTQQLAEFANDPQVDPLFPENGTNPPGNRFPPWLRPASMHPGDAGPCGGTSAATATFLLEPTDVNLKNDLPESPAFTASANGTTYHLENVALLPWYAGPAKGLGHRLSFPSATALVRPAGRCRPRGEAYSAGALYTGAPVNGVALPPITAAPVPRDSPPNGRGLIGYWLAGRGVPIPLRKVSPQWDVVLIDGARLDREPQDSRYSFRPPTGMSTEQFKASIQQLQHRGTKVMVVVGAGKGEAYFPLTRSSQIPNFVDSVSRIVRTYGFDGVDIDFEMPYLPLQPGDSNFKHPTTPSVVNTIAALRELHQRLGPNSMLSIVPEGMQIPAAYVDYGGQFGSELPIVYALRDLWSFVDWQDYNTPPLEGLDGEIYQAGTAGYDVAETELMLHGFDVDGNPNEFFPPLPASKVAVGFLTADTTPSVVSQAMRYLTTGHAPAGARYKLQRDGGYPGMMGAMFWTLNADQRANYAYSNLIGPLLHR